jgi:hypothetical protein
MTRRVGTLSLSFALGAVLSAGCIVPGNDQRPLPPDRPRPLGDVPPTVAVRSQPALPADSFLREPPRADAGIRQAIYPEAARDRDVAARPAGNAPAATTGAAAEPPGQLPSFEIRAKTEEPLVAALRCFLDKHPAEAVECLKGCDRANKEALLCLLPLAVRLNEGGLDGVRSEEAAQVLDELHALEVPLRRRAPLRIEKMCFCKWIEAFGRYDPIADGQAVFEAGCNGQLGGMVQVYAEVRNFASEDRGPVHLTRLVSWAEIRDYAQGKTVARIDFDNKVDESRSPRQDYFINYRFRVPAHLPPGPYTLWIYVKDALAQPTRPPAQRSLDFRVVAGGSARGSRGEPAGLAAR